MSTIAKPGRHADGGGLYLYVDRTGAKRWVFLYRWKRDRGRPGAGRLREMGLGSVRSVPLARAREKATEARALIADGCDPLESRPPTATDVPLFKAVADELIAVRAAQSKSETSIARWRRGLHVHCRALADLPVDKIGTDEALSVLKPIWSTTPEMAQKTRGYLEAVLDAAKAKGHRTGENPARWRGHLDHLLPKQVKLTRGHHAAMPFVEVPEFVSRLRQAEGVGARALEFAILTAGRTGEVLGARWQEVDLGAKLWVVPGSRMKGGREHRVPLVPAAINVLEQMKAIEASEFIFPGERAGRPLSSGTLERVLDRMVVTDATVHGFRSSFRDWAGERTSAPREIAEAALAHVVGNETERAYRRGDALERRRELMNDWATYCGNSK